MSLEINKQNHAKELGKDNNIIRTVILQLQVFQVEMICTEPAWRSVLRHCCTAEDRKLMGSIRKTAEPWV